MAEIRAMAVFQGGSNLPEDRFVNTFHFISPGTYPGDSASIATAIDDFYSTTYVGNTVGSYLSPYVKRAYEVRTYDMSTSLPRVPAITAQTLPAVNTTTPAGSLPEEVAVCLSYHTIPPITARRRGRIYLGPLCGAACGNANVNVPTRVEPAFAATAGAAAAALANTGLGWSVYSPTADEYGVIVGGWVDNAFDTQRRRGGKASLRNAWVI